MLQASSWEQDKDLHSPRTLHPSLDHSLQSWSNEKVKNSKRPEWRKPGQVEENGKRYRRGEEVFIKHIQVRFPPIASGNFVFSL